MTMHEVKSTMRTARRAVEMTQQELADLAGVDRSTIWRVESGRHRPHKLTRVALATALRCDPDTLFGSDDGASPPE
jgi:transcriptional regulator with XRE-family HTH domain